MGANYQIKSFNTAEDIDQTIEVQGDRYILETAVRSSSPFDVIAYLQMNTILVPRGYANAPHSLPSAAPQTAKGLPE
jgi:hypothetical protein